MTEQKTQGWQSITRETIDIRDGIAREIYVDSYEKVKTKKKDDKGKVREATKYSGLCNGHGPISFLATDTLAEAMEGSKAVNQLFQIQWKGKKQIADGKLFNVFQVLRWSGPTPSWVKNYSMVNSSVQTTTMTGDDDYPTEVSGDKDE